MKTKLLFLVAALALFIPNVMAADVTDADSLESCLSAGGTCTLMNNIEVNKTITLDKNVELNLNGNDIAFTLKNHILLEGGNLNITGKGSMYEKEPWFSPIRVIGSVNADDTNYTTLTVGKNVTLKGWAGIFITYTDKDKLKSSRPYGITVNLNGKAIGVKDSDGSCDGAIYLNGNITDSNNAPVINISSTAKVESEGHGIYAAGYGKWTVENGANIKGITGIELRAGILDVKGGTITGTASTIKSEANGNGPTTVGAGIAIVQHTTKLPIKVNIKGGTITGAESVYVNDTQGNGTEAFSKVNVQITSGSFNNDVMKYIANTCTINKTNGMYNVTENKILESNNEKVMFESESPLNNKYMLAVKEVANDTKTSIEKNVEKAYKDNNKIKDATVIDVYDINITDGTNIISMEKGNFTISIAIAKNMQKYDIYKVAYIDENGNIKELLDASLVDGNIVFTTSHLSTYAIIGYNSTAINDNTNTTNKTTTNNVKNPSTNDINLPLILLVLVLSLSGIIATSKKILQK